MLSTGKRALVASIIVALLVALVWTWMVAWQTRCLFLDKGPIHLIAPEPVILPGPLTVGSCLVAQAHIRNSAGSPVKLRSIEIGSAESANALTWLAVEEISMSTPAGSAKPEGAIIPAESEVDVEIRVRVTDVPAEKLQAALLGVSAAYQWHGISLAAAAPQVWIVQLPLPEK